MAFIVLSAPLIRPRIVLQGYKHALCCYGSMRECHAGPLPVHISYKTAARAGKERKQDSPRHTVSLSWTWLIFILHILCLNSLLYTNSSPSFTSLPYKHRASHHSYQHCVYMCVCVCASVREIGKCVKMCTLRAPVCVCHIWCV